MSYKKSHIPDFKKVTQPLREAFETVKARVKDFADEHKILFVARIKLQAFPSFDDVPLSQKWKDTKARLGLDARTMIATYTYINNIKVMMEEKTPQSIMYYIGFDENDMEIDPVTHEKTHTPLTLIAQVHEYGSAARNTPPRPHWTPYLRVLNRDAVELRRQIARDILARLTRMT